MEHCQNGDIVHTFSEIHTIWEMAEKGSTNLAFQLRKLLRVIFDTPEDFVDLVKEPHAQATSLVFVPQGGCLDIEL
jgi:hypothetical protein